MPQDRRRQTAFRWQRKLKRFLEAQFTKICLGVMFLMVLAYTAIVLWIFAHMGSEPTTLTISFFALMTGECGMLAVIKKEKIKKEENDGERVNRDNFGSNTDTVGSDEPHG